MYAVRRRSILIGGVFVLEALSVILQAGCYKLRKGKRIFKMAPLHHHFELMGWSESKAPSDGALFVIIFGLPGRKQIPPTYNASPTGQANGPSPPLNSSTTMPGSAAVLLRAWQSLSSLA